MILISVKDYNRFSQDYYESIISSLQFHQLTCTCGHSGCLAIHAYYKRGIFIPEGIQYLRICRVKCSECGKTHAILPSSLVPYDRISLSDQHMIIYAYSAGNNPKNICSDNPMIDETCVRAVIQRFLLFWLQRLLSEAISLDPIPSLVTACVSFYSLQFMQIRRTALRFFSYTT